MSRGRGPAFLAALALLAVLPLPASGATSAQLAERLQGRGIRSARVLDAFRRVRREAFLAPSQRSHAYDDAALDIGHGQVTSQPFQLAAMLEQLGLRGKERVLEIGTGSGYGAAVLAALARDVYSVEIVPELAVDARLALAREGCLNAHVKQGDGQLGWREYGPYDAIIVTGAGPAVPPALVDQLKEGGVLVMPIDRGGRQVLLRGVKQGAKLRGREVAEMKQVPALVLRTPPREPAPAPARVAPSRPIEPPDEEPSEAPRLAPPPPPPPRVEQRPPAPPAPPAGVRRRPSDEDDGDVESAPRDQNDRDDRDLDDDDDGPSAGRPRSERPSVEQRDEAPAPRDLNEEDLPEQDEPGPRSDTRPRPDGRIRAARAPGARDSDRRRATAAPASAAAGSPRADRQSAA